MTSILIQDELTSLATSFSDVGSAQLMNYYLRNVMSVDQRLQSQAHKARVLIMYQLN